MTTYTASADASGIKLNKTGLARFQETLRMEAPSKIR